MAYSKYDIVNRNYEARIDRYKDNKTKKTTIVIDGNSYSGEIPILSTRILGNIEELSGDKGKFSNETNAYISKVLKNALKAAVDELLPMKEEQFSKGFAKKKRNTFGIYANESWGVGFASGATSARLSGFVSRSKASDIVKATGKQYTIKYAPPLDVMMRLNPKRVVKYNKLPNVSAIEKWIKIKESRGLFIRRDKKKTLSLAFAIANSWKQTWKPQIMDNNALLVGRNSNAVKAFNSVIENNKENIAIAINNQILKNVQ